MTLLLTGACTAPQSPTTATTAVNDAPPPAAGAPQPKLSQRCTNAEHGFSISYPEGWRTNDAAVIPACAAFHPEAFDIPRDSEMPFEIAVVVHVEKVPVEQLTRSTQWERVISAQQLVVAGRNAHRVEVEASGEGLAERGMRTLRYVVELGGGRVLIASTHDRGNSYARNGQVLARMIETVTAR